MSCLRAQLWRDPVNAAVGGRTAQRALRLLHLRLKTTVTLSGDIRVAIATRTHHNSAQYGCALLAGRCYGALVVCAEYRSRCTAKRKLRRVYHSLYTNTWLNMVVRERVRAAAAPM